MAKPAWQRREQRAQAKGYRSYWDYRLHNYGKLAPDRPTPTGELRQQLAGRRSYNALIQELEANRVEQILQTPGPRDPNTGQYSEIMVDVQLSSGKTRSYRLYGDDLKGKQIQRLRQLVSDSGTDIYVNPSLDILGIADEELAA